jgi:hypothetical protein
MANRIPLVVDAVNQQIEELPAVDALDLGGSSLVGVGNFDTAATADSVAQRDATGQLTATNLITADKIIHDGDTDTAIRFPAADTVTVETAGLERVRVNNAGNLGIGTAAPRGYANLTTLTINGTNGAVIDFDANGVNTGELFSGASEFAFAFKNNSDLVFYGNTNERMRITNTGNVGIGTSAPAQQFHIKGADNKLLIESTNFAALQLQSGAVRTFNLQSINTDSGVFRIYDVTADAERMRIDSSGNVGIGTSSPAAKFQVETPSDGASSWLLSKRGGSELYMGISSATGASFQSNDILTFGTGASFLERMRIDSSGGLLVGTTTNGGVGVSITKTDGNIGRVFLNKSASGNTDGIPFAYNGSYVGGIQYSDTAVTYVTSSDYRLKEDLQPVADPVGRLMQLKPINFAWKIDGSRVDGFLAHEAQEVVPEAVTGEKDGDKMQAIDHSKLVPLLTAALQDALKKIDDLEVRLNALESK